MLRTERSRWMAQLAQDQSGALLLGRELLFAVAPPPRTQASYALSGWPSWLDPVLRRSERHSKIETSTKRTVKQ